MTDPLVETRSEPSQQQTVHAESPSLAALASVILSVIFQAILMLSTLVPALRMSSSAVGAFTFLVVSVAVLTKTPAAVHVALWVGAWAGWWNWISVADWPLYLLGPLGIYAAAVLYARPLRRSVTWISIGEIQRIDKILGVLTVVISSAALLIWLKFAHPDLSDLRREMRAIPTFWIPLAGIGFAVLNAILEEAIWRGIIMQSLQTVISNRYAPVIIQGISFGIAHVAGFPRGWLGVGMATVYGTMLGILRKTTGGIALPIIVHVFADLTIFVLLVTHIR